MDYQRFSLESIRSRSTVLLATSVLALGLSACSSEGEQLASEDTATYVETDAYDAALGAYDFISTDEITATTTAQPDAATKYTRLENINPTTKEDTGDFPLEASAPALTVTLGRNNRLKYEDMTPGLTLAESELLALAQDNAPLLTAAMATKRLHSLRFRIYEPDQHPDAPDLEPSDYAFFLPRDYTDGSKPNIYYFLPAKEHLDASGVRAIIGHEAAHAALEHNEKDTLTPAQRQTYATACRTLRTSAIEDMTIYGNNALDGLYALQENAPPSLRPVYEKVLENIKDGSYGTLPVAEREASEVLPCYIQPPTRTVSVLARKWGLGGLLEEYLHSDRADRLAGDVYDNWNDAIEDDTVYRHLKEANWLPPEDDRDKGHPQDGVHEIAASSLNRLIHNPEAFGSEVGLLRPGEQQAIVELLEVDTEILMQKYPDAQGLRDLVNKRRAAFDKASA